MVVLMFNNGHLSQSLIHFHFCVLLWKLGVNNIVHGWRVPQNQQRATNYSPAAIYYQRLICTEHVQLWAQMRREMNLVLFSSHDTLHEDGLWLISLIDLTIINLRRLNQHLVTFCGTTSFFPPSLYRWVTIYNIHRLIITHINVILSRALVVFLLMVTCRVWNHSHCFSVPGSDMLKSFFLHRNVCVMFWQASYFSHN